MLRKVNPHLGVGELSTIHVEDDIACYSHQQLVHHHILHVHMLLTCVTCTFRSYHCCGMCVTHVQVISDHVLSHPAALMGAHVHSMC